MRLLEEVDAGGAPTLGFPGLHDGILAGHAAVESAVELGAEGELAELVRLLFGQGHALLRERLVLHSRQPGFDVADLRLRAVRRPNRRRLRWRHAVRAIADRGPIGCDLRIGGREEARWLASHFVLMGGSSQVRAGCETGCPTEGLLLF